MRTLRRILSVSLLAAIFLTCTAFPIQAADAGQEAATEISDAETETGIPPSVQNGTSLHGPDSHIDTPMNSASMGGAAGQMYSQVPNGVVDDGVYALRNKATGKYLDIQYDSPNTGMYIQQYAYGSIPSTDATRSGLFKFTHRGNNNYLIRTMRNNGTQPDFSFN